MNQGHRDFQSLALPTELLRPILCNFHRVGRASSTFSLYVSPSAPLGELLRPILCNFHWVGRASSTFSLYVSPSAPLGELLRHSFGSRDSRRQTQSSSPTISIVLAKDLESSIFYILLRSKPGGYVSAFYHRFFLHRNRIVSQICNKSVCQIYCES